MCGPHGFLSKGLVGFYVNVERHTTAGRMDVLIQTSDYIYILELKVNQTAAAALQQMVRICLLF